MASKKKNRVTIELRPLCMAALLDHAKTTADMPVKEFVENFFSMALMHHRGAWLKLNPPTKTVVVVANESEPELPLTEV